MKYGEESAFDDVNADEWAVQAWAVHLVVAFCAMSATGEPSNNVHAEHCRTKDLERGRKQLP
jgi:hypothetical protein